MSLETATFIKDLVATNPEGTDPKSQGDDHLRMLKEVLKTQFSGLNQGKAIVLTEDQINRMGGSGNQGNPLNIDTVIPYHAMVGVVSGMTGTLPAGWAVADMIFNIAYNPSVIYQIYFLRVSSILLLRQYNGTWGPWIGLSSIAVNQNWQGVTRSLATTYTNDTGRPIAVSACINGVGGTVGASLSANVGGIQIIQMSINESIGASYQPLTQNPFFIVPPNQTYSISTSVATTIAFWRELR